MAEEELDDAAPATPIRDWRYVVGTIGKVLIATGLLLMGFVAYQLWGTGIETRRAQTALEDEFAELLAATPATTSPTTTLPTTTITSSNSPTITTPITRPATTIADTIPQGVVQSIPTIVEGDPVARLEIPAIGVDDIVVAGVSVEDLRRGPGHYPDTPLPGQLGNSAIAGHRTTYGQPFADVDQLEPGDEIVVTTVAGRFVYAVTGTEIVEPTDSHVVATTDPDVARLTLTSCHPRWSARQRIIVYSELIVDESAEVGEPTIGYAAAEDQPATTTTAAPTVSTAVATGSTVAGDRSAPPATGPAAAPAPTPAATPAVDEAFSHGWFHDRSAIPHVVIWGLIVAAIAAGARLVGRRVGSRLLGVAAGVVPFLVALYFFYESVNRLLPPSL